MCAYTCSFETVGARDAPEGHSWLLQSHLGRVSKGLSGTLNLWVLGGKVAAASPHPKHGKGWGHNLLGLIS